MTDIDKRLHYFDHQFLVEADFTEEQEYHMDRRRRHNRVLHGYGAAGGLQVRKSGEKEVTVTAGTAFDRDGQEIVQGADHPVDLSDAVQFPAGATVYLTIAYGEAETHPTTATGVSGNTRVTETPVILASTTSPPGDGSVIRLARLTLSGPGGTVPGSIGDLFTDSRQVAGAALAPQSVGTAELAANSVDGSKIVDGSVGTAELANGAVTGVKLAANSVDGTKIVDGSVGSAELANGAVTGAKLGDEAVAHTNLDGGVAKMLVTNGNGHDHAGGDGAQIRHSNLNRDDGRNPHGTLASDVGALPASGGTLGGNLQVNGSIGVSGTVDGRDVSVDGTRLDQHVSTSGNPHNTTAAQVGALPSSGGTVSGNLTVSGDVSLHNGNALIGGSSDNQIGFGRESDKNVTVFITGAANTTVGTSTKTAVLIWPLTSGVSALNIFSATGGVDTINVAGTARFTGTKIGYVADTFINASGQTLRTGDLVKLKGTGVVRFHGDNNRIPIPEVTLADRENDPLVIGIVCQEAAPGPDQPDSRSAPEDPTFIPEGGELLVVTLGTFAHCKVDASEAPIEVGDLLTSSKKPGHAKKATDPKIGAIIGKALEPLKEGTGYISVFVNIQ